MQERETKGSISPSSFSACSLYLLVELVPVFPVLLKGVRIQRMCEARMKKGNQFIGKSCFYNLVEHPRWNSSTKIVNDLNRLTIFAKKTLLQMFGWIPKAPPDWRDVNFIVFFFWGSRSTPVF